jgi:hypothetical protein
MASLSTTSRAHRPTHHINRKPASNLHHAVRIAEVIGLPLNYFVTLNFSCTCCQPDEVSRLFSIMRANRFGPWVKRPGRNSGKTPCPATHAWVIEAAGGVVSVHWLVHIPPGRVTDFTARLPGWLVDITSGPLDAGAVKVERAYAARGASKYMLKGIDPAYAAFYGVQHVPQGVTYGRRSGYSNNLGPSVKRRLKAAGKYKPRRAPFAMAQMARAGA